MIRKMNEIEVFSFDGIIKLSESKWGKNYTMGIISILYLHHLKSRGICGNSEDDMKTYLMREGHSSNETLNMIKKYKKVKDDLFEYSHREQEIFDKMIDYGNTKTITSWEQIENLHMGIIQEAKGYRVVDISQGSEKLLATIQEGVNWKHSNLTNKQMNFITKNARLLKQPNGII